MYDMYVCLVISRGPCKVDWFIPLKDGSSLCAYGVNGFEKIASIFHIENCRLLSKLPPLRLDEKTILCFIAVGYILDCFFDKFEIGLITGS